MPPEAYHQNPDAARGGDGAAQEVHLPGPAQRVTVRYTDGCAVYGLDLEDPLSVLLVDAGQEAIIEVNRPIVLVLGVASPDVQERYRGV